MRAADLAVRADAGAFLRELLPERVKVSTDSSWVASLQADRDSYRQSIASLANELPIPDRPMHPATLALAVGEWLGTPGIAVFDGGHTSFWSNDLTPVASIGVQTGPPVRIAHG